MAGPDGADPPGSRLWRFWAPLRRLELTGPLTDERRLLRTPSLAVSGSPRVNSLRTVARIDV